MKQDVAVFIHTFLRDGLMNRCVESVEKYLPGCRIYLSDGGRMTEQKKNFYDALRERGHWVKHYSEFNPWWRKVFNEKVKEATERFIIKVDDDFYFTEESNLDRFISMKQSTRFGLIGGRVFHENRNEDSPFIYEVIGERNGKYILAFAKTEEKGITDADFVPDFWIANRQLLLAYPMDEDMEPAQGAHEKFFTDIYENDGPVISKIGYTNEVTAFHEKGNQSQEYLKARSSGMHKYGTKIIKP